MIPEEIYFWRGTLVLLFSTTHCPLHSIQGDEAVVKCNLDRDSSSYPTHVYYIYIHTYIQKIFLIFFQCNIPNKLSDSKSSTVIIDIDNYVV